MTCLGVVLDRNMTMAPHLIQAMKDIAVLKYAAQQQATQKSLVQLRRATVGSRMEYGLHRGSTVVKTALGKLQQVQNEAMRRVTAAAIPTSCDALHYWLVMRRVWWSTEIAISKAIPESNHFSKSLT